MVRELCSRVCPAAAVGCRGKGARGVLRHGKQGLHGGVRPTRRSGSHILVVLGGLLRFVVCGGSGAGHRGV